MDLSALLILVTTSILNLIPRAAGMTYCFDKFDGPSLKQQKVVIFLM